MAEKEKLDHVIGVNISPSVVSPFPNKPWFLSVCNTSLLKTLWGKREIACNQQFLFFPQCFLPVWRIFCNFHQIWNVSVKLSVWKNLNFVTFRVKKKEQSLNYSCFVSGNSKLNKMCLWNNNAPETAIFFRNVTLIFDLDLADDLDFGTSRCVQIRRAFIPSMSLITKLI